VGCVRVENGGRPLGASRPVLLKRARAFFVVGVRAAGRFTRCFKFKWHAAPGRLLSAILQVSTQIFHPLSAERGPSSLITQIRDFRQNRLFVRLNPLSTRQQDNFALVFDAASGSTFYFCSRDCLITWRRKRAWA